MIAWRYIDKPAATIAAIKDYNSMRNVINITPQEIKELYDRMISPRATKLTGLPRAWNPRSGEEALAESLDKLDVLQERYRQAIEYMGWFEPAWGALTDEEQHILREFYMTGNQRSGAAARLQCELNYSERQIERLRSKALSRLSLMLFGK